MPGGYLLDSRGKLDVPGVCLLTEKVPGVCLRTKKVSRG